MKKSKNNNAKKMEKHKEKSLNNTKKVINKETKVDCIQVVKAMKK